MLSQTRSIPVTCTTNQTLDTSETQSAKPFPTSQSQNLRVQISNSTASFLPSILKTNTKRSKILHITRERKKPTTSVLQLNLQDMHHEDGHRSVNSTISAGIIANRAFHSRHFFSSATSSTGIGLSTDKLSVQTCRRNPKPNVCAGNHRSKRTCQHHRSNRVFQCVKPIRHN